MYFMDYFVIDLPGGSFYNSLYHIPGQFGTKFLLISVSQLRGKNFESEFFVHVHYRCGANNKRVLRGQDQLLLALMEDLFDGISSKIRQCANIVNTKHHGRSG